MPRGEINNANYIIITTLSTAIGFVYVIAKGARGEVAPCRATEQVPASRDVTGGGGVQASWPALPPSCLHRKTGSAVTYHRFPNYLVTRENWIFARKRKVFKAHTSKVCSIHFSENDYERDLESGLTGSERLKNRTVKRKLVSDLTETRERKIHPENSKCEENKNNGTHVVTQGLNEQTMCQPGPSTRHERHSENTFFFKLN
ncbi:hypothetical protein PR048_003158 [Dryococelus australis]|uniref:THAP-type domain-containing protein n=1 Tax=Dryococelus australis TaxID=614101 RepID=A0ABQ9IM98_9NEOP|nr:hypothetical protein PR048_003158 [Dryococelus australis]